MGVYSDERSMLELHTQRIASTHDACCHVKAIAFSRMPNAALTAWSKRICDVLEILRHRCQKAPKNKCCFAFSVASKAASAPSDSRGKDRLVTRRHSWGLRATLADSSAGCRMRCEDLSQGSRSSYRCRLDHAVSTLSKLQSKATHHLNVYAWTGRVLQGIGFLMLDLLRECMA